MTRHTGDVILRRRESHAGAIYAIAFNQVDASLASVFATVGANRVSVYRLESSRSPTCEEPDKVGLAPHEIPQAEAQAASSLTILQAYCDADDDECFYCCAWGADVNPHSGTLCGSLLAVGGAKRHVKVLDACTGTVRSGLKGHGGAINEVQFHPRDRALLFSASADESIRLWHTGTAECLATFSGDGGHLDAVVTLDVRLDGAFLATGSIDGTIKLWSLLDQGLLTRVKRANAAVQAVWGATAAEGEGETASDRRLAEQTPNVASAGTAPVPNITLIDGVAKSALAAEDVATELHTSLDGDQPGSAGGRHVPALAALKLAPLVYQQPVTTYDHIHFDATTQLSYWVDCVRFIGELLLSRASDGTARLWQPCNEASVPPTLDAGITRSPASDVARELVRAPLSSPSPRLIREFRVTGTSGIWYLRFALDASRKHFAMGNAYGEVVVWDIGAERAEEQGTVARPSVTLSFVKTSRKRAKTSKSGTCHPQDMARCTAVSSHCEYIVGGCDDGSICVWALSTSMD